MNSPSPVLDRPNTQDGASPAAIGAGVLAPSTTVLTPDFISTMPLGLQIYFDKQLKEVVWEIAEDMAGAKGIVPGHLAGNVKACFFVANLSIRTRTDAILLAQGTYVTPNGMISFMTRAVQTIIEGSGLLKQAPKTAWSGPWENLVGKFEMVKSNNGNGKEKWYAKKAWKKEDAKGCKLELTFHFSDRAEPEEPFEMELTEVGTFFSTAWATEPKNQFYRLVCRRAIDRLRPSALAGIRALEDVLDEEAAPPMKDVTPTIEKSSTAGLDEFAAEETPAGETIVEPDEVIADNADANNPEDKSSDKANAKSGGNGKAAAKPTQDPKPDHDDGKVTLWMSVDETARVLASVSNAVFVLRNAIKDAKTPPLAQELFDQNLDLINEAGDQAVKDLEAELNRRLAKDDGRANGDATAETSGTVWLGPEDKAHAYTNQGNAVHLMTTAIRNAATAAAAKIIRDQNAVLIDSMPGIAERLDFEVSKRFQKAEQKKSGKLV